MSARQPVRLPPIRGGSPARERGAVLVVALILLTVLTLLGVSALNSTSLEERMASNTQELYRTTLAAEAGLDLAFNDDETFDLAGCGDIGDEPSGKKACAADDVTVEDADATVSATVSYSSRFNGMSPPPMGSLYSATAFQAAHFDLRSEADRGELSAVVHGGAYQIAPKM
jgi:hypothetical protein